ncbi:hypothetical protein K2X33_11870 [bacterium]|nr:hypothetical protein [bacterium]
MTDDVGLFFSFFFAFLGISAVANPQEWKDFFQDLFKRSYSGVLLAFFLLPIGMVILTFHNNWESGFALFITVCGWLATSLGFLCLLVPSLPAKSTEKLLKSKKMIALSGGVLALFSLLSAASFYW